MFWNASLIEFIFYLSFISIVFGSLYFLCSSYHIYYIKHQFSLTSETFLILIVIFFESKDFSKWSYIDNAYCVYLDNFLIFFLISSLVIWYSTLIFTFKVAICCFKVFFFLPWPQNKTLCFFLLLIFPDKGHILQVNQP